MDVYRAGKELWHLMTSSPPALATRYGPGSWVLITGGSEGIGLEFARIFARSKFNIIIISRSQEKLSFAKSRLEFEFPEISILTISQDFSLDMSYDDYATMLQQVADLDVSVLINNVGI